MRSGAQTTAPLVVKILAITPYAGSKKLVAMTEAMLRSFATCVSASRLQVEIAAMNNAAERHIEKGLAHWNYTNEKNEGFGNAINLIIKNEIIDPPHLKVVPIDGGPIKSMSLKPGFTHVLLLNNDLEFPQTEWLQQLVAEAESELVLSPCTDVTATAQAVQDGPVDLDPIRSVQVSAFCWLVPVSIIHKLRKKFGFNLFHPDFSNYGSDDVTAACLRSFIQRPFKIVPRAWVRHLKAQTANELGVKAGTPELLKRIANYKRARRLS